MTGLRASVKITTTQRLYLISYQTDTIKFNGEKYHEIKLPFLTYYYQKMLMYNIKQKIIKKYKK